MTTQKFSETLKSIEERYMKEIELTQSIYDKLQEAILNYPNPHSSSPQNYYNIAEEDLPFITLEDILNDENFQKHINEGNYTAAIDYTWNICSSPSIIAQIKALVNRTFGHKVDKRFYNTCIRVFNEKMGLQLIGPHDTMEVIREFGKDFYHMRLYLDIDGVYKMAVQRKVNKEYERFDNMGWNDFLLFLCDLRPSNFNRKEMDKYKINYAI